MACLITAAYSFLFVFTLVFFLVLVLITLISISGVTSVLVVPVSILMVILVGHHNAETVLPFI